MRYIIYFCLLLFTSSNVLAAPFEPTVTDKSIEILGLFGNIGNMLGGKASPALQAIFEQFNTAVLTISIIVLGYITIVSLVNTAQEGTVMGKKWSSAWIPLKAIFGIFLLLPITTSGYSIVQAMVMWLVIQGVGFADNIWGTILDYLAKGISVTGTTRINPSHTQQLENTAQQIFDTMIKSAVCEQALLAMQQGRAPEKYKVLNNRDPNINSELTLNFAQKIRVNSSIISATNNQVVGNVYFGVRNDPTYQNICGGYTVTADSTVQNPQDSNIVTGSGQAQSIFNAKVFALSSMYDVARYIARVLVSNTTSNDETAKKDVVNKLLSGDLRGAKYNAIQKFTNILSGQIDLSTNKPGALAKVASAGKSSGWAVAGSYYFMLYRSQISSLYKSVYTSSNYQYSPARAIYFVTNKEKEYLDNSTFLSSTYNSDPSSGQSAQLIAASNRTVFGSSAGFLNAIASPVMDLIWDSWIKVVNAIGKKDYVNEPLVNMALVGQGIMLATETVWLVVVVAALGITTIGAFAGVNFGFLSVIAGLFTVGTVIMAILGLLYVTGILIGIYLPMLPYLIYTAAILGWATLVIEAIVGAPLIALGIIVPSQSELGRAGNALNILGNIFLRPALMVIAFVFSAKLFAAIIEFVNFGFYATISYVFNLGADPSTTGVGASTAPGFLSPLFAIIIYSGFIIAIANRVFNLIHMLPDKIMRWIGGAAETVGQEVGAITQQAKQEFDKSSGEVSKTMSGMATKGMESISNKIEADKKKNEDGGSPI